MNIASHRHVAARVSLLSDLPEQLLDLPAPLVILLEQIVLVRVEQAPTPVTALLPLRKASGEHVA